MVMVLKVPNRSQFATMTRLNAVRAKLAKQTKNLCVTGPVVNDRRLEINLESNIQKQTKKFKN